MKRLVALCLFLAALTGATGQQPLTSAQWQEDLDFLQQTVHRDYPFLFKKVKPAAFDAEVAQLRQAIPTMAAHEVMVGLSRLVSSFQYGHTQLPLASYHSEHPLYFQRLPYNLYAFSGGIYVQGTHERYASALGARVLQIGALPIEEALRAVRPVVPAENDQYFRAYGLAYLALPEVLHATGVTARLDAPVKLLLEKDGRTFAQDFSPMDIAAFPGSYGLYEAGDGWLDARKEGELPLWRSQLDRIYFYEYLPEHKTVYVRHSQIQDEEEAIPEFFARVFDFIEANEVERLILDVRLNGGGNNYKNKAIIQQILRSERINQPGHLFVILGRRTFSAAQNLVNELHNYTEAIFVGEPTSENINFYGDNRRVDLPNSKLPVFLSFAWWQDKPQWENQEWLAPHLAVEMSFADYRDNRDPALETVLAYDAANPITLDPLGRMMELYEAGRTDQLEKEARQMVADPRYRYYDFEGQLNRVGYRLLEIRQYETALYVFTMVTRLYPESANAWDSLAEGHWKAGDTEQAESYYQKAIALDPQGSIGDHARQMLQHLRESRK